EPDDRESWRPFGDDHVLQEVCGQEVVERESLERRDEDGDQEQLTRRERETPLARSRPPDLEKQVPDSERRNDGKRVRIDGPRVRVHAATLLASSGRSSMVEPRPSKSVMRVRFPPPALLCPVAFRRTPASCVRLASTRSGSRSRRRLAPSSSGAARAPHGFPRVCPRAVAAGSACASSPCASGNV